MTPAERYAAAVQAVEDGVMAWNAEQRLWVDRDGLDDLWVPITCRRKIARAVLVAVDSDERLQRVEPYPRPYPWGPAGDGDEGRDSPSAGAHGG